MPWVRADLRGQLVYARADASGALLEQSGRVEIRYRPNDGRKYRAAARNLSIKQGPLLPDDTCGEADAPEHDDGNSKARKTKTKKRAVSAVPPKVHPDAMIAYTDGACSGNPGPAGLGVVVLAGEQRIELYEYLGEATNNVAELTAILRALAELDDTRPAAIHTDSQYAIGVLQKGWKAKKNVQLVADLRDALTRHGRCTLVYVKAHAGIPLNERADLLARTAIDTRSAERRVVDGDLS